MPAYRNTLCLLLVLACLGAVAESSWAQRRYDRNRRDYRPKPNPAYPAAVKAVNTAKANLEKAESQLEETDEAYKRAVETESQANTEKMKALRQIKQQLDTDPRIIEARAALSGVKDKLHAAQERVRDEMADDPDYQQAVAAEEEAEAESARLRELDVVPEARRAAAIRLIEAQTRVQKLLKAAYAVDKQASELQEETSAQAAALHKLLDELEAELRADPQWQGAIEAHRQAETERSEASRELSAARRAVAQAKQELSRAETTLRKTPERI